MCGSGEGSGILFETRKEPGVNFYLEQRTGKKTGVELDFYLKLGRNEQEH